MDQLSYVHDRTSNLIFLDRYVSAGHEMIIELSDEQYTQAAKTIAESALIFEMNNCFRRLYYRPFGQYDFLLIGVLFTNGIWKVKEYFENPSAFFLLALFKRYLLHNNITIYRQKEFVDDFFGSGEIVQLAHCLQNNYVLSDR